MIYLPKSAPRQKLSFEIWCLDDNGSEFLVCGCPTRTEQERVMKALIGLPARSRVVSEESRLRMCKAQQLRRLKEKPFKPGALQKAFAAMKQEQDEDYAEYLKRGGTNARAN